MVDKAEALAELYRRGALKGAQKAAYEEAARRGLVGPEVKALADARKRVSTAPNQVRALAQGVSFGFADELDAKGAGIETAIGNIGRRIMGKSLPYTPQQAEAAVLQANREGDKRFQQEHPIQSLGLNVVGGAAIPLGGFVGAGRTLPAVIARSAAVGAGMGAVGGAGASEGGFADRLAGAGKGALVGAVAGAATPVVGRVAQAAGNALSPVTQTVTRAANRMSGGRLLDPQQTAGRRLAEALRADGVDQATAQRAVDAWAQTGSLPPSLMDVAGRNTMRLIRAAAAPGGEAENVASAYSNRVTADLQDNATGLARRLTPYEGRNAEQFGEAITDGRATNARVDYAGPYAEPVAITPEISSALSGEPGRAAVGRALQAAVARRDGQQIQELTQLQRALQEGGVPNPDGWNASPFNTAARPNVSLPPVSGATLDRIQIALGQRGRNLMSSPTNRQADIAGGIFGRQADVNAGLDSVPGLADARQSFRSFSDNERALQLGADAPFSNPDSFAAQLGEITGENPMARMSAGVGVRSDIVKNIGAPAANATGYLNKLATGTNTGRVLGETFGPEAAGQFRAGIGNEVRRVQNARAIDPSTNSQTAGRTMDQSLVEGGIPRSASGLVMTILGKITQGARTLTDAERRAIVEIGSGDATAGLNILQAVGQGRTPDPRVASVLRRLAAGLDNEEGQRQGREPAVYVEEMNGQRYDPYGNPIP